MRASRPSASIALRTFWLTVLSSCGRELRVVPHQVSPSRSVGSFAPFACRMNVRRMPSAPPNSPASKTTLSRGEAMPGTAVPGSPEVGGGPVVLGEDERREVDLAGELDEPVQRGDARG